MSDNNYSEKILENLDDDYNKSIDKLQKRIKKYKEPLDYREKEQLIISNLTSEREKNDQEFLEKNPYIAKRYRGKIGRCSEKRRDSFINGDIFSFEVQVKRKNGRVYVKEIYDNRSFLCTILESSYQDYKGFCMFVKSSLIVNFLNKLEKGFDKKVIKDNSHNVKFKKLFYTGNQGTCSEKITHSFAIGKAFSFEVQIKRKNGRLYIKEISDNRSIYSTITESVRKDDKTNVRFAKCYLIEKFFLKLERDFNRLENPIENTIKNSSNDIEFKKAA